MNGSENWSFAYHPSAGYVRFNLDGIPTNSSINPNNTNDWISNLFESKASEKSECLWINNNTTSIVIYRDTLIGYGGFAYGNTSTYVPAIKDWLNQNNVVVYYTLATPTIVNATPLPNDYYANVIVDDGIVDYTVNDNKATINYIEGNITTVEDGEFIISKPTKIITYSNIPPIDYDLSSYVEYGTLEEDTYTNLLSFISDNSNKDIKIFLNDTIFPHRYKTIVLDDKIIISSKDNEFITIYPDDTYISTHNLEITYTLEGYKAIDYTDGKFDNTVLAFFWVIPALLVGGLIYLLLKRKE